MSLGWSTQQIWLRMRRNQQYQPIWFLFDCNQSSTLWVIYFRQCQIYGGSVWCREDCGEIHPTTFLCFTCMPDFSGRSNWTIRQIAGLLLLADRSQKLQPNMLLIQASAEFFWSILISVWEIRHHSEDVREWWCEIWEILAFVYQSSL